MSRHPSPDRPAMIDPALIEIAIQRARVERSEAARALVRASRRRLGALFAGAPPTVVACQGNTRAV